MPGKEQTLSASFLSPEAMQLVKENSELLQQCLRHHSTVSLKLGGVEGKEIILPESIIQLVFAALDSLASGKKVKLLEEDEEVSPEKAAEFLQVPPPYLMKLLDKGEIPFHDVGTQRRILMSALIVYKQQRKIRSTEALQRMVELAEAMDLYDE